MLFTHTVRRLPTLLGLVVILALLLTTAGEASRAAQHAKPQVFLSDSGTEVANLVQSAQNVEFVGQIGGEINAVAVQGSYAYVGVGARLEILNIYNPASPTVVGKTTLLGGTVQDMMVVGGYAYVADGTGLRIISISAPSNPYEVGFCDTPGWANGVVVSGSYAYIADDASGLRVVNVSTPSNPYEAGFYDTPGNSRDVVVAEGYAYVADGSSGLRVINVSAPSNPYEVGFYETPGNANGVAVAGSYAYIADGQRGLRIVNVSSPSNPREMGSWVVSWPNQSAWDVTVTGGFAYVAYSGAGVWVVDVSAPSNLRDVGHYYQPTGFAEAVAVAGSYAYVAYESAGLRVLRISSPSNPYHVGSYETLGYTTGTTVVGNHVYVADGYTGLKIVSATSPSNPVLVGSRELYGFAWDVAVVGSYAYVADGHGGGLKVLNISSPSNPYVMGSYYAEPNDGATDVAVVGSYAYVAYGTSGLRVVNVSSPSYPYEVGYFDTPGSANGVVVIGGYAYVADGTAGLRVVDISSPWNPHEVGFYDTPGNAKGVAVVGHYAYVADGTSGLQVLDVSTPSNPFAIGSFDTPGDSQDVAISGDYAYVADGGNGLRVVDVSIPWHPQEEGFYEIPGWSERVTIVGDLVYLGSYKSGLWILRSVTYTISGRVTEAGGFIGILGATVWAGATRSTTTDANGNYTFTGLPAGTYAIRPEKAPYAFSPPSRTVSVPGDQTGVDFRRVAITKIQVNQVLGNTTNYVAGKDTVIQVMLSDRVPYDPANQQVVVKRNGAYITTLKPIKPAFPTQTLNFWGKMGDCGNWQQGSYTFEATVNGAYRVADFLQFHNRATLRILAVPVRIRADGQDKMPSERWKSAYELIAETFPIASEGIAYTQALSPLEARDLDLILPWNRVELWARVAALQPLLCGRFGQPDCYDLIIAVIPQVSLCVLGECIEGWTVLPPAVVAMDSPNLLSNVAHELGHLIGSEGLQPGLGDEYQSFCSAFRCSANPPPASYSGTDGRSAFCGGFHCSDPDVQAWDSWRGSRVVATQDAPYEVSGRGALDDQLSFMGAAGAHPHDYWVTPRSYDFLFAHLLPDSATVASAPEAVERIATVSGWITADGHASLNPVYYSMSLPPPAMAGPYTIEVLSTQNAILASQGFDVSFTILTNPPEQVSKVPFRAEVRLPRESKTIRLMHGGTVLVEMQISASAPSLSVISPVAGEIWPREGNQMICWQGSDLDGDTLYYTVLYRQGGGDWSVLGADLTTNELTVDAAGLPGGPAAQVQVLATDGINTTAVESGLFTVGRKGPEALITYPAEGASFMPGVSFFLQGTAHDLEDGRLPDSAYRWTSNRDGDLGTGASNLVILSPSPHVITLTVTDSDGNTTVQTIRLSAGAQQFLPLIWRSQ